MTALRYVGNDPTTDWIPGVPARDLSDEECDWYPQAEQSSLYEAAEPSKPKRTYTRRVAPKVEEVPPTEAGEE